MKWHITYLNESVFKAIKNMPMKLKARYVALADRMIENGPDIGMPHTCAMGDGLFEVRVKTDGDIARVFYCTQVKREIVVLYAFIKKTQQTPKKALDLARKRLKEVKNG